MPANPADAVWTNLAGRHHSGERANVVLLRDGRSQPVASKNTGPIGIGGTSVAFADRVANAVRIYTTDASGLFEREAVSSLGEVEVIAKVAK